MLFSTNERAKCAAWFKSSRSVKTVQRNFAAELRQKPPSDKTILNWHSHLMENGSVQDAKRDRARAVRTEENVAAIQQHFLDDPHTSTRRAAATLQMSRTSIQRVLKDLIFHPYKVQIVQKLHGEDIVNRLQFAREELTRIDETPSHLDQLIFSDEADFHIDGQHHREPDRIEAGGRDDRQEDRRGH